MGMRLFAATTLRAALLICLQATPVLADMVEFTAKLTPVKLGDSGKGSATLSLDTASKTLSWSIEYAGLPAAPALAGFLAPALKPGEDASMVPMTLSSNAISPITGSMQLTDVQITGIQNNNWILMLGTEKVPEIGGEVHAGGTDQAHESHDTKIPRSDELCSQDNFLNTVKRIIQNEGTAGFPFSLSPVGGAVINKATYKCIVTVKIPLIMSEQTKVFKVDVLDNGRLFVTDMSGTGF
jgi:hypothetical protein